ncbi:MAG TPA: ectonucleotide pyrophosphatase/phosphodiesterase [Opitutaceae bacterium]|nr:ectonucleotide pyrophosphatase/phosphodiesterase [Opitutaceae bacterium]
MKTPAAARASLLLIVLLALAAGRASLRAAEAPAPVLLVSMDGFRWNYPLLHPEQTPHLHALASAGISARELIPVYPSNTFPNHYSIVTGLYPAHHGIINNNMFDARLGAAFHYTLAADNHDPRWWGGEPIWVTAIKQGRKSACYYWVGAEAPIEGVLPTYLKPFSMAVYTAQPFQLRIDTVLSWLRLPADRRPAVICFYIEETNSIGHKFGPESPQLVQTLALLDGRIGALMAALDAAHQPVNLIVVSDHGMTDVSPDRVEYIDDYVSLKDVQIDFQGPEAGLHPINGAKAEDLMRALSRMTHAKAYLSQDLPGRFHLRDNPRIPPIWIAADEGWHIATHAYMKFPGNHDQKGDHGFDNAFRSMHGILIAHGPAFKTGGTVIGPVANIHLYNLMCAVLGLRPAPNDGDDRLVKAFLR